MADKIDNTLEDRGKTYGDFSKMSATAQFIKRLFKSGAAYNAGMPGYQKEALDLIATKLARIVDGDPYHEDSWHDIVGYATLALDRVREELEIHPDHRGVSIAHDVQMPIIKKSCTCGFDRAIIGAEHEFGCPMYGNKP